MNLPAEFIEKMKNLLGDEFDDYISCYQEPRWYGLRVNTAKISVEEFERICPFEIKKVPWIENGFYYEGDKVQAAKHPYYFAGLYYLQEPSAMTPASRLPISAGDKVLDVCAAPGGKATELGAKLAREGVLAANDISNSRAKGLLKNIEVFGIGNVLVLSEEPGKLEDYFTGYFDKVVIDAPCSGQGMFRKDEVAITDWSYAKVLECQSIQKDIIRDGYDMLKNGGILVYSTCTFAKEENEDVIIEFISEHEDAKLIEMQRIWPHKASGEGHFVAKIQKLENEDCNVKYIKIKNNDKEVKDYREFEKKFLNISIESRFDIRGENLYLLPEEHPDTKKLKVLRYGLHLGMLKKNRFEPSHALAHYLKMEDVKNVENFSVQDDKILDYLRGNTIETGKSRGWVLVCVEGIGLGWGKESNGILKNHYPKGLRINY